MGCLRLDDKFTINLIIKLKVITDFNVNNNVLNLENVELKPQGVVGA